jgi:hypothetical protein
MKLERIRNLILFHLYSRGRSKRGSAEFLAVSIGVVASLGKHPFVVTIPAYLIEVLVARKPWIVMVSQVNGAA